MYRSTTRPSFMEPPMLCPATLRRILPLPASFPLARESRLEPPLAAAAVVGAGVHGRAAGVAARLFTVVMPTTETPLGTARTAPTVTAATADITLPHITATVPAAPITPAEPIARPGAAALRTRRTDPVEPCTPRAPATTP